MYVYTEGSSKYLRDLLELELYMIVMCMTYVMGNKLKPSEK